MWGKWEKLSSTAGRAILAGGQRVPRLECRLSSAHSICSPSRAKPPRQPLASFRHSASIQALLLVGICCKSIFCTIPFSGGGASVQSDDHHVQANLPAAKTTTHTMRNRNIETAKLACFLNSLRPSLIRVVRRKNIERTKRKIGIAAARKARILKIIVHSQCRVNSFIRSPRRRGRAACRGR